MTPSRDLEAAYRRRLRAYPRGWRQEHGEELLAVLLDAGQDCGRCRPASGETLDLLRNGLATRARDAARPFSPTLRGRVATLSLAGGASMALVCLLLGEMPPFGSPHPQSSYQSMTTVAPFLTAGALLYLGWLVTAVLTVAGRLRPAGTTGAVLLALSGGVVVTGLVARSRPIAAPPVHLAIFFAGVSLLVGVGRVDLSRTGRWLLALGSTGLAGVSVVVLHAAGRGGFDVEDPRWVFYRGWRTGIQLIAGRAWILLAVALVVAAAASRRSPGWFAATAVAGLPWLYFALLFIGGGNVARPYLAALALCALAVVVGLAAVLHRAGSRTGHLPRPDGTS